MLTKIGIGIVVLFLLGLIYSLTIGSDDIIVKRVEISFAELPSEFDGKRIVHISDIHIQNYNSPELISKLLKIIEEEKPDLLVYTGDYGSVDEMRKGADILRRIETPLGKYAILGNHDYGNSEKASDNWKDEEDKIAIKKELKSIYEEWGVKLLLNESDSLVINNQAIGILGVEVFDPHHGFYDSNIDITKNNTNELSFKILLTHNPDFWANEILGKEDIQLTLAGHTHGGQVGFILGPIRLSVTQAMYDRWAGLYEENRQYLYVNTGLGWYGVSLRMGIPAEVTTITLINEDGANAMN